MKFVTQIERIGGLKRKSNSPSKWQRIEQQEHNYCVAIGNYLWKLKNERNKSIFNFSIRKAFSNRKSFFFGR